MLLTTCLAKRSRHIVVCNEVFEAGIGSTGPITAAASLSTGSGVGRNYLLLPPVLVVVNSELPASASSISLPINGQR